MRDFTSELLRREIPRPLHPRRHGRAALVAAGSAPPSTNTPPTAKSTASPPTAWRAKYPRRPRRVASARVSHVGWPWHMRTPTLVGARVPRARRHPTPTRGSVVGRPAPGTGRRGRRPLPLSHPHPLGPYHSPTRTRLAPTIVPPAPTWSLPFSRPHPLGPYRSPARTHLAPTILPPAPTRPLPLSRPHPLGPDVGSTTAWRAKSPRRPRRGASTLSHPCVHPMRVPRAAKLPQKSEFFFVIEGCRRHTFMCRASRGYAPRPIKQGESGVSGGVCAACIFFSRPPCAHGGCVVYSWRL